VIETRDRFHSEIIIFSRSLGRHIEYNIDYDDGTLFFKQPIYSKDENLNPIFIVIDYETKSTDNGFYNYGGRGAVKFLEQKVEIGTSYIHEGPEGGEGDLTGMDATVQIGESTQIKAEYATSKSETNGDDNSGDAYLAEISHQADKLDARLYVREQDQEFGLGQQNASEGGTRKIGLEAGYPFTQKLTARGQAYRQYNLDTDAERDVAEVTLGFTKDNYTLRTGYLHAEDRLDDGTVNRSEQITTGASHRFLGDRLQLRADHAQSVWDNQNADFPTRTILGADYKILDPVTLFGEQEFTFGDKEDTQGTRLGMKAQPWQGGQVGTSMERQYNENGARLFANLGLAQTLQVNDQWSVDGGLDHSRTVKHPGNEASGLNEPPASGGVPDFTAISLGTTYREEKWEWNWRGEYRTSGNEDKWNWLTGIYGEPRKGLGLSAAVQLFRTDGEDGAERTEGDIRLGMAYRPRKSRWTVLDRLDLNFEKQRNEDFDFDNWRIVNNLNANYKMNAKTQIALQYGAKYVKDTIDNKQYSGYTDLIGMETRYDLTKKWDIGLHGNMLHSWNADQFDYSTGVSLGYNVMQNAWVSVGYNFLGFEDEDFSRGNFTAQGPFMKFRVKVDQQSVRDVLGFFQGKR
jgi:hypothetical protein